MRALITRPLEDAETIAQPLRQRGIAVMVEPLLAIEAVADAPVELAGVQAVLATSANGIRALARASDRRDLPVFAVGDSTARTAHALGYPRVESAAGDVAALAALVAGRLDPAAGALIHAAGSVVAGDLSGRLGAAGFCVRRAMLYQARAATALTADLTAALREESLDLGLFFSPRTAATFVNLIRRAGLDRSCRAVVACCLSAAVAQELATLPWRDVLVAARPEQHALLAMIDERFHTTAVTAGEGRR